MGEQPNYAAFALPVFALGILVEVLIARRRGRLGELYSVGTAVSDIGCGAVFQAIEVLLTLVTLSFYAWLYQWRVVHWDEGSPWPWVLGLVGVDLLYYWWHRISHVSNVMWAVHGVHHQSEDFNLAVALRQPILEPITLMVFFWVLAVLGVPPLVFVISFGANLFYQFWIHTELVDRLPRPLEWVLNTPSHHRVHHGVDEVYLDRNYGGVLVVWDRLFGTFQAEEHRPTYGTTVPLRSYAPLWGNAQHLHRIWRLSRAAPRLVDTLWVWFAHPGWLPHGVTDPATKPDRSRYEKYRPPVERSTVVYVLVNLGLVAGGAAPFVFMGHAQPVGHLVLIATTLVLSHVVLSGLIEGRPWASTADWVRMAASAGLLGWLAARTWGPGLGLVVAAAGLVGSFALRGLLRPRAQLATS